MKRELLDNTHSLTIVCDRTGIAGTIDMPSVPGFGLEYTHPLAHYTSALSVATSRPDYLRKLQPCVLAGVLITLLRKHKMIHQPKGQHSVAINERLCEAKVSVLVGALYQVATNVVHFENSKDIFCTVSLNDEASTDDTLRTLIHSIKERISQPIRYSKADEYTLEEAIADEAEQTRKKCWEAVETEQARKDAIRAEAKAKISKKASPVKAYTTAHLDVDTILGKSVLAYHIEQLGSLAILEPAGKLFRTLVQRSYKAQAINAQQKQILDKVSHNLANVEPDTFAKAVVKLESQHPTANNCIVQMLTIFQAADQTKELDSILGDWKEEPASIDAVVAPVAPAKPMTLRERIAARKAGSV